MGLIYLDSCVLIYAVERDPVFGDRIIEALNSDAADEFAISSLVKLECLVKPLEAGNLALQRYYEAAFETLVLLPMTDEVYVNAAQLRAKFNLRTPDALHLSCAQFHQCRSLWTNDDRMLKSGHGLVTDIVQSQESAR